MQRTENIFHKLISNTINENEINTVRFKNLNNNYSKVCLSILLQTFTNHPDANLASQFLNNNENHSFYKFILKFEFPISSITPSFNKILSPGIRGLE